MIKSIRNSFITKGFSITMIVVMFFTMIAPINSYGLTGGPAQPEFNSFTPIGTSDMVDLASGDFSYNIPLMDIGGFPINLAYNSGITMDQEASWVGLGWNLSIGQINRQMRGLPDDFDGDQMVYENDMKDNFTVGGAINFTPAITGAETPKVSSDDELGAVTFGVSLQYNNYTGFSLKPSLGVSADITKNVSLGLNVESGPDGMSLTPSASFHGKKKKDGTMTTKMGSKIGATFNSRQGLTNVNMSVSHQGLNNDIRSRMRKGLNYGGQSIGSSISFFPNHYTPQIQDKLMTENYTFNAAIGSEFFGGEGQGQIRAFASNQFIPDYLAKAEVEAYGYDNTHSADEKDVKDFNREKDGNFSVNSTNLPITNYTYDIYSVQGQGVGGMFRPFRSQIGYVNDRTATTYTNGGSQGVELGLGNTTHAGVDVEVTDVNASTGIWKADEGNNALTHFESSESSDKTYEEVYFRNVGDLSADVGAHNYTNETPVRLALGGSEYNRELSANYVEKNGASSNLSNTKRTARRKRNQTILKVKNADVELEPGKNLLGFTSNGHAKAHHTAGFVVTRNDGARYIYGEALYNTTKKEISFSMANKGGGDCLTGLIDYDPATDATVDQNKNGNQYFNSVTTPAYSHTFLLTTLLSSDYSDVKGDGLTDDDLGSYTKFTYTSGSNYRWRVPFQEEKANFNEGLKSDTEDDKGSYVYGEKEMKYIDKIETKTHIAVFHISARHDGFGVNGESGGLGSGSEMQKLDKIELFSKGEYYIYNPDGSRTENPNKTPIKTAHFEYGYDLCKGIPNNDGLNPTENAGGKLTLKKVYFTYRNSNMGKYSPYEFTYGDLEHDGTVISNPNYNLKEYNIWGGYKPFSSNTTCDVLGDPTVPEFNYIEQEDELLRDYSAAWSITDIELPSGGEIQIDYESDDYAYVQDKKAMQMFKVVGAGTHNEPTSLDDLDRLYDLDNGNDEASFLYIELPQLDQNLINESADEDNVFYKKYIENIVENYKSLIQFRFFVNMGRKGGKDNPNFNKAQFDYINGYFELEQDIATDQRQFFYRIFEINSVKYATIPVKLVDMEGGLTPSQDVNPIAKAGWQFGRKYLSRDIYDLGGVDTEADASMMMEAIFDVFQNLKEVYVGPNGLLRGKKIARRFIPEKSWIRLMNPNGMKKGGGCRVKEIRMNDGWDKMTEDENQAVHGQDINENLTGRGQSYGQEYTYTTTDEKGNTISSGVCTYEPVGALDNPLIQPVFVNINRVLGPDEENYMETPFGESFFPSPAVTYSRVSVKNLERNDQDINGDNADDIVNNNATGHVVTEFYTSKDFPTVCDQTDLMIEEDGGKKADQILQNLLKINVRKHLTLSQGYTVHKNDMNGKMKKQLVFAQDHEEPISGALYVYNGAGVYGDPTDPVNLTTVARAGLRNSVTVIDKEGNVSNKKIGVEVDVINDFREMKTETTVAGVNYNTANFIAGLPITIPLPLPNYAHNEEKLNVSVTTKVINSYGIQTEVIAFDAGASVSTKNVAWDEETGEVLLTQTTNEYSDQYYSLNYPAHWYYPAMGLASFNSGAEFEITHNNGGLYSPEASISNNVSTLFYEGDEILITDYDGSGEHKLLWVSEVHKDNNTIKLINQNGVDFSNAGTHTVKIIRSGKRNLANTSMGSIVTQKALDAYHLNTNNPNDINFLSDENQNGLLNKIINSGAVHFSDNWEEQCDRIEGEDGTITTNPYVTNQKGVWRADKSYLYLAPRLHNNHAQGNHNDNPSDKHQVDPRNDGFYTHFSPFYKFGDHDGDEGQPSATPEQWFIDLTNWTYTSEVTEYNPYGFEIENKDALGRYSSAQYGYNNKFPTAVSANARYSQIGFDGFEDYNFQNFDPRHFNFRDLPVGNVVDTKSHTGRSSLKLEKGEKVTRRIRMEGGVCD